MCTNYRAPTREELKQAHGIEPGPSADWETEVYRDRLAPIIRRSSSDGKLEAVMARFRLIPALARGPDEFKAATMNARSETVDKLWSFKHAWAAGQRCVIPAQAFYEPLYASATSRSQRWSIARADGRLLAIAGLWDLWERKGSDSVISFAMLTINCDEHPLLNRFHRWFDETGAPEEKRTPVLLRDTQINTWLNAEPGGVLSLFRTFEAEELSTLPAPKAPRVSRAVAAQGGLPF